MSAKGWRLGGVLVLVAACDRGPGGPSSPGPTRAPTPPSASAPAAPAPRKVLVEVDQMAGTPRLEPERVVGNRRVSLRDIYAEAGLEVEVRFDQTDLPRADEVGPAELHAMMLAYRSVPVAPGQMHIHLLVATRERDRPDTLGVMFDFGEEDADGFPREGFAVFADVHEGLGSAPGAEMLLTAAHELAHCFNLHHSDWEGQSFRSGASIEGYSLADTTTWRLSRSSRQHLGGDPLAEVWPGQGSLPFGLVTSVHHRRHQSTPSESLDVIDPGEVPNARRGRHVHASSASRYARDRSRMRPPGGAPLTLTLKAPQKTYVVGEPVVLTVGLHNEGPRPVQVVPLLAPEYRLLALEVRAPGSPDFEPFQPGILADGRAARARPLAPGDALQQEAKVFFGADGWTFREPGTYVLRADYPAGGEAGAGFDEEHGRIESAPLEIEVVAPRSGPERRAKELVFGHQQGMYLLLGGADHLKKARGKLTSLAEEAPQAAQAAAVKLALGAAALSPTVDPATKVQSAPRLEEAERLLAETLTAALPPLSVAQVHAELAEKLEKAGQVQDAKRIRRDATRSLRGKEGSKKALEKLEEKQR